MRDAELLQRPPPQGDLSRPDVEPREDFVRLVPDPNLDPLPLGHFFQLNKLQHRNSYVLKLAVKMKII